MIIMNIVPIMLRINEVPFNAWWFPMLLGNHIWLVTENKFNIWENGLLIKFNEKISVVLRRVLTLWG